MPGHTAFTWVNTIREEEVKLEEDLPGDIVQRMVQQAEIKAVAHADQPSRL